MPEEILIIVIVSILAGTTMSFVRLVLGYKERTSTKGISQGASMTTSELERIMKKAVEEATEPLAKKVEDLEFELATKLVSKDEPPRQLEQAATDLLLDLDEELPSDESIPKSGAKNRS